MSIQQARRAFVAIEVPEVGRQILAEYLTACAAIAPGYRWVEPSRLHLTLCFLGAPSPAALDRIREGLRSVTARPLRLTLGGLGMFGPTAAPSVIWLDVRGDLYRLNALAAEVGAIASPSSPTTASEWPFRPHLTLATNPAHVDRPARLPHPPRLEPWTVTEIVLFETPAERRVPYLFVECFPLHAVNY